MDRKKVLFITNLPTPYRIDCCNELGKLCDLTVLVEGKRWHKQQFDWNDTKENLTFKLIYLEEQLHENKIKWRIFPFLKRNRFNNIIIGCYHTRSQSLSILYLKLKNIPYYFETDGGIIPIKENWLKRRIKQILIKGATGYFSPCKNSDNYLMYYGACNNLIYRCPFTSIKADDILDEPFCYADKIAVRNKLNIKEKKIILSIGQFIFRKGFDILIQAAQFLSDDVGIYIVGGEPTEEYLSLAQKVKFSHIHFVEFKQKQELSAYFQAADLFVLPTREDIWGLVINEAMAYGLPVVSTTHCNAALELVSQQECIVEIENVNSLSHILQILINNSEKLKIIGRENLLTIRKYTIKEMAISIYNKLQ
ncbi:MAG: glycosyltransferase family 4 protein [Bacteroidales bacterium]|jgi:glycosyltransferase involved in cell wall biosynthesis|nr:glycosyltransferase family 4 protein [Bacteroidales bacterium]